ncbi:hypothetical protein [Paracoccus marcusii]|uniref:hypothetical protein n=1 Tax=Paracoccus marcusii TaxID=59779 RepID=UPI003266819E
MLDAEVGAEAVEIVVAGRSPAAKARQAIGELLAVVGQHAGDRHRRGALQIPEKATGLAADLAG